MTSLLAVDLGLKMGLALYGQDGRLIWYRSRHFGSAARLRRAVPAMFTDWPDLSHLVLEGGGPLAEPWRKEAARRDVEVMRIGAETWRQVLLYPRQQRCGPDAKGNADGLARRVITWSGAPRPTSLRHDAAEAILIGLWAVLRLGWLEEVPVPPA